MSSAPATQRGPTLVASPRIIAPLGFGLALVLRWAIAPLSVPAPSTTLRGVMIALGGAMALGGFALAGAAVRHFRRAGENPKPESNSNVLVVAGPYRFSRNPMYSGGALAQVGVGIAFNEGWFVVTAALVLSLIYFMVVRHEETYLLSRFGDSYRRYMQSVRRWL